MKNLAKMKINKELKLQMTIKTVNNIASANGLIFTLLIFRAYLRMHHLNPSAPNIIQSAVAISKTMNEIVGLNPFSPIIKCLTFR